MSKKPAYRYIRDSDEIPLLGETEMDPNPLARVKLFTPWSNWTWYVLEYDPKERIAFGLVDGFEKEFGEFSIEELEDIRGPAGLRIERDLHWKPRPVKELK